VKTAGTNLGMTDVIPDMIEAIKLATIEKMKLFGCCGKA